MRQELLGIRRQLEAATADARAAQQNSIDIEINYRHIEFLAWKRHERTSTLISETMAAKGLRKAQIVSLLGFKNITKGIRRLDAFVVDGVDSPGMLDRLPSALGVPAE